MSHQMCREVEGIFLQLAPHASVLCGIFQLAGQGGLQGSHSRREIARLVGVGAARLPDVIDALLAAENSGAMEQVSGEWRFTLEAHHCYQLGLLLKGVAMYREKVHQDLDRVRVVLSKPPQPSRFVAELESTLEGAWGFLATSELLGEMAARAEKRLTIMTPFVDASGANRIVQLFAATREGVERELIVRDGMPSALVELLDVIRHLGVKVFDFRLPRTGSGETETFHAKVVGIDGRECYVGSSNMTRWSFEYSLELGFHVTGKAASNVSRVLDAVVKVSSSLTL